MKRFPNDARFALCALLLASAQAGCFWDSEEERKPASSNVAQVGYDCTNAVKATGTPWVPDVDGVDEGNHDPGVTVFKDVQTKSGLVVGINEPYTSVVVGGVSQVVSFEIDMSEDLLEQGSISLVAEAASVPGSLSSDGIKVWPVLISLRDGSGGDDEWVKMENTCAVHGFFRCVGTNCVPSAVPISAPTEFCAPVADRAFLGDTHTTRREKWEESQRVLSEDEVSVNRFPTCNWGDTAAVGEQLKCPFNNGPGGYMPDGKLPSGPGRKYVAQYVLLSNAIEILDRKYRADVKLTVIRKKDGNAIAADAKGALDLNVVLVGSKNIADSRTEKGKQNLNALFQHVQNHYYGASTSDKNRDSTGVRIGKINVFEWECPNGGDYYANVPESQTGEMFAVGSKMLPSVTEGKALNLFLVSTVPYNGSGTILGKSGGILGSMVNGTAASGLVFSSFNKLATFNSACSPGSGPCLAADQDASFLDMGGTISHEMGHFLGLNHPSESNGTQHDWVRDTPICTDTQSVPGFSSPVITINRCKNSTTAHPTTSPKSCSSECSSYSSTLGSFCPQVEECQFNHTMWWTSKNFDSQGNGDGNLFSTDSGALINFSPFVQ